MASTQEAAANRSKGGQDLSTPSISLPKGGGAIRGMGEKFAANPVTGTGSMSVPIAASPGRSGFGPELSLSYDSGAGNGPFGFGWNLSLPSITRKTDKGLPKYLDARESDVFILSGAEDLVPILNDDGTHRSDTHSIDDMEYQIHRYRPRIEGLFARIERWTNQDEPKDVHWRSISKDNILTIYGKDENSRISDPQNPQRIFTWLICETRDDRGNAVLYQYKPEDGAGVVVTRTHERNRGTPNDARRTANRYLKHIRYGNRRPLLDDDGHRPIFLSNPQSKDTSWMFEVVFDYGEHDADVPTPGDTSPWAFRADSFSSYRSGFEVRTTRLCQRVLMFHHFPDEKGVGENCLVRSTDFTYSHQQDPDHARNPVYTFLLAVTQSGYKREGNGYLKSSLPPLEFEYTQPVVQDAVEEVDATSLENLPIGLDGSTYQWTDLHGDGIPGILTEQAGTWLYKRNLSPVTTAQLNGELHTRAKFAPLETVAVKPTIALAEGAQFMDLAGDGQPDLVVLDDPMPGLYEQDGAEGWQPFRPFTSRLNRDMRNPNLRFVDLDGDGHADVLITENDALVWHPSLEEVGFGPAYRVAQALDEEQGPRVVFADGEQSIYLADFSGDGLTDLVRIRNGEVCYWPNLGYGQFGAKITMDHAPHFDHPDHFDQQRIRLADIDGAGTTDIIYLHCDGVRLYFNQSGNSWSEAVVLPIFPHVDELVNIMPADLLGNGTACLVWSSPLPGDTGQPLRYVNLMGGKKPHLLVKTVNNLSAETRVHYTPSTRFYLEDKLAGNPWITRLPFPVHVVERVETCDYISRNSFVTRYRYHHGYFDGAEREFHGFGMVEQFDTEQIGSLAPSGAVGCGEGATNIDAASHVPPVLTRTWFHTGTFLDRQHISRQFENEYYREPGLTNQEFLALLLPDTTLPIGLTLEEEREACRALKGMILRQEIYALDGTEKEPHPYSVSERDYTLKQLEAKGKNRHAVFFAHPRETIDYHYERNPADPRIQHTLTLEVDDFGNVLKEAAIGYGRRERIRVVDGQGQVGKIPNPALDELDSRDQVKQIRTLITYTENGYTKPVDTESTYRKPLPYESRTYEMTGLKPGNNADRFSFVEWTRHGFALPDSATEIPYEQAADNESHQKRLIEHARTLYRSDDLSALLPLGELDPLALPGESYRLAFTSGLLAQVYERDGITLMPDPAGVLGGQGADQGGYILSQSLKDAGNFPDTDPDGHWWIPSGRIFFSPGSTDTAQEELAHARRHFFVPHRSRNPFGAESIIAYDKYDLLMLETLDPVGNRVTAGERDEDGTLIRPGNDYRVLQPGLIMDPNRNRTEAAFDAFGMVVGTAVMGKPEETLGDSLDNFNADLDETTILAHLENPLADPHTILGSATTRLVYDLFAYSRTRDEADPQPASVYTLARETHVADLGEGEQTKIQHSFSYSDGFGREIQQKGQAEPGPVPTRDANGKIIVGPDGRPELTGDDVSPRWVGSGWTVFNNKEDPVRQYEPFFTDSHRFEFDVKIGVSPVLFYDPVERVIATLHPNHTWKKVVFDPWRQETWDVNDTVMVADPKTDPDVGDFFRRLPEAEYRPTWHALRTDPAHADDFSARYPEETRRVRETQAARKTEVHSGTPTLAHFDTLGRTFLTAAHNRFERDGAIIEEHYPTRLELDIEGNEREVSDALGRVVMRYDYNMARQDEDEEQTGANRIHQVGMEAGERWILNDVMGNPIRAWDSREHMIRTQHDLLRRPVESYMSEGAGPEMLVERTVYGETRPNPEARNLRGQVVQVFDQAGVVTSDAYDFKGNLLRSRRQLAREYKTTPDWSADVPLEAYTFTSHNAYDALNRPTELTAPDNSIIRYTYNEANLLKQVDVNLGGAAVATRFVEDIDYNARGQRERIEYGNGVVTRYEYDPLTFRLVRLKTTRPTEPNGLASQLFSNTMVVQDLRYSYDPAGNILLIADAALKTVIHDGQQIEPVSSYIYDAIYRLIEANGREHIGQTAHDFNPTDGNYRDYPLVGHRHPNEAQALRNYTERYEYDAVGNFDALRHVANGGSWTRRYEYEEESLIEAGKQSNRLTRTTVGNDFNLIEPYTYDAHGNITSMPHLPLMRWDYRDQLQATAQQVVNNGGVPETTYYVYDAAGQRARKVTERQVTERQVSSGETPTRKEERIYLGGFERYREYNGNGSAVTLERETLHVMDDEQRIALVETRTQGSDPAPEQLIRYQLGNHLGSASLELDAEARIISYEEYTPYGSTSYQAVRSQNETPKRYRYTGKERDAENGLNYHGARYYAPWLGRWIASDPAGRAGDPNGYAYSLNNPVTHLDSNGKESRRAQERANQKLREERAIQKAREDIAELETRMEEATRPPPRVPVEEREGERLSRSERWSLYWKQVWEGETIGMYTSERWEAMQEWSDYLTREEFAHYKRSHPEFREIYYEHEERYAGSIEHRRDEWWSSGTTSDIGEHGGVLITEPSTAQYRRRRNAVSLSRAHAEASALPFQGVLISWKGPTAGGLVLSGREAILRAPRVVGRGLKVAGTWESVVIAGEAFANVVFGLGRSGLRISDILAGETFSVAGEPISAEEHIILTVDRMVFIGETLLGDRGRKISEFMLKTSWKAVREGL